MHRKLFNVLIVFILIWLPNRSFAQAVVSGYGTPVIDGEFSSGEWRHADSIDIQINRPQSMGGASVPGKLYVMNDATNLYLAILFLEVYEGNAANFQFDNNNSGGAREPGDDSITFISPSGAPSGFSDGFYLESIGGVRDTDDGGSIDGEGAFSNSDGHTVYEFAHPLDSDDDSHDFSLSAGDLVPFNLHIRLSTTPTWEGDVADTILDPSGPLAKILISNGVPAIGLSEDGRLLSGVQVNCELYDVIFGNGVVGEVFSPQQVNSPGWKDLANDVSRAVVRSLNALSGELYPRDIAGCTELQGICVLFLPEEFFAGSAYMPPLYSDSSQAQVRPDGAEICGNCGSVLEPGRDTSDSSRYTLMTFSKISNDVCELSLEGKLQELYVGVLGRAADRPGLDYWLDQIYAGILSLENTRAAFTHPDQAEYTEIYGGLDSTQLVIAIYENFLEREPDTMGLLYWASELDNGRVNPDQMIVAFINAIRDRKATGEQSAKDLACLNNKVEAARYFTEQTKHYFIDLAYREMARAVISNVTDDPETLDQAKALIDEYVGNYPAPAVEPMKVYLLSPEHGEQIPQNNPATGCTFSPSRGSGVQIFFDWSDASSPNRIAGYHIYAKNREAQYPLLDSFTTQSEFTYVSCGFVIDANLTNWEWYVQAEDDQGNLGTVTPVAEFQFEPCRLEDGSACWAGP